MQVAHLLSYLCIKILLHRTDGQMVENKLGQETLIAVANWMWTMGTMDATSTHCRMGRS